MNCTYGEIKLKLIANRSINKYLDANKIIVTVTKMVSKTAKNRFLKSSLKLGVSILAIMLFLDTILFLLMICARAGTLLLLPDIAAVSFILCLSVLI